jgi:hypothetical protein
MSVQVFPRIGLLSWLAVCREGPSVLRASAAAIVLLALVSCGKPPVFLPPESLRSQEGSGEFRAVAECVYNVLQREPDFLSFRKTDMSSAVYIDKIIDIGPFWRLSITPRDNDRTRIELIASKGALGEPFNSGFMIESWLPSSHASGE